MGLEDLALECLRGCSSHMSLPRGEGDCSGLCRWVCLDGEDRDVRDTICGEETKRTETRSTAVFSIEGGEEVLECRSRWREEWLVLR